MPDIRSWFDYTRVRFWLLVGLLVYTLFGFFGLPWILERQAVNEMAQVGRTLTVEDVRTNPFTFEIEVKGLNLDDSDGVSLISWQVYRWNFELSSLFRWAWTFKEIHLEGLALNLERFSPDSNRFGKLLSSFAEDKEPEVPDEEASMPRVVITDLVLIDARLHWTDHLTEPAYSTVFGPISVEIHNLSTLPDDAGQQSVSIRNTSGGTFTWSGSVQLSPLASEGHFQISGRALDDMAEYLDHFLPFTSRPGEMTAGFDYSLSESPGGELEIVVSQIQAKLNGLSVVPDGEDGSVIDLSNLIIDDGRIEWPAQDAQLGAVTLQGLTLDAWLESDGSFNLERLVPGETDSAMSDGLAGPEGETETPWQIRIDSVHLEDGKILLQDRSLDAAPSFELVDVSGQIDQVSSEPGSRFPSRLKLAFASGGHAAFDGEVELLPELEIGGQLQLDDFALSSVQDYAAQSANVQIRGGLMGMKGEVNMGPSESLSYGGSLSVTDLDVYDGLKTEELLSWKRLEIDRAELSLSNNSASLSTIELEDPVGRIFIAEDQSTNIGDLVIEPVAETGSGSAVGAASAETPFSLNVAGVQLQGGVLDFSDFSLPLPFETRIQSLGGSISALSNQSSEPADVNMEGQVDDYGQARILGHISPLAPTDNTDIGMIFRNLEISRLTPYSIQFAGYAIDAGKLDLDLKYRLAQGQLEGANAIVIRELTLGEKVDHPDAASLPLGLAVALLKDSEGVIDIDLPVSGDLNDPEFSYGGVIAKAIFNLITKVVTAPFRLLGNLVGIDSEDFGTLEFQPGLSDISPPDREKLVKLEEAMALRPELVLEVTGVYDSNLDREALKRLRIESRIDELEQSGDEFSRRVIESLFTEAFPGADLAVIQAEFTPSIEEGGQQEPTLDTLAYVNELKQRLIDVEEISTIELERLASVRRDEILALLAGEDDVLAANIKAGETVVLDAESETMVGLELKVSVNE